MGMKERIYTIPVSEAFRQDCECTLCYLEKKLEDEEIEYYLGPSLMEPDHRKETNETGFCTRHYELLYNRQENTLGLALIIETHLADLNTFITKEYDRAEKKLIEDSKMSFAADIKNRITSKPTESEQYIDKMVGFLKNLESKCSICKKLDFTMDRYIDVMLYLWFTEDDFRELFNSKKGFCLLHLRKVLEGVQKYLTPKQKAIFVNNLMKIQTENLARIQDEVNWFTRKFDYRYKDAPWKNSKDAVPRSIEKITGFCRFNR